MANNGNSGRYDRVSRMLWWTKPLALLAMAYATSAQKTESTFKTIDANPVPGANGNCALLDVYTAEGSYDRANKIIFKAAKLCYPSMSEEEIKKLNIVAEDEIHRHAHGHLPGDYEHLHLLGPEKSLKCVLKKFYKNGDITRYIYRQALDRVKLSCEISKYLRQ